MRALLLTAPGELDYVAVPEPVPGEDDVLVRVAACGICGSDVHGFGGGSGRRVPPLIMGHEAAGTIIGLGRSVSGWQVGQAVTFDSTVFCGRCRYCRDGVTNLCDQRRVLGVSTDRYRRDGAFAERVVVPARTLYPLPPEVSMIDATLAEPLAVAVHAVSRADVTNEKSALVVGSGMIGLLIIMVLRAAGCDQIIAVDVNPTRLARASSVGATDVVLADAEAVSRIEEATGRGGADVAFEAVGVESTLSLAMSAVRKGATVVLVGNVTPTVAFPLQLAVTNELTLSGSAASRGEFLGALDLMAKRGVDVGCLVSEVVPLADGASWFERLRRPQTDLLKVVLLPSGVDPNRPGEGTPDE
jgi:L-iditol 2-dehydrogenase